MTAQTSSDLANKRRVDETLKRMLSTPPDPKKPKAEKPKPKKKPA